MTRLLLIPLLAVFGLCIACSDDDGDDGAIGPAGPGEGGADAEQTPTPDGLQYVVDSVDGNIRVDELRPHLNDDLQSLSDEEIRAAVTCFPSDVVTEVTDMQINEQGSTASVVVTWRVTGDAAARDEMTVTRTWEFERRASGEESGFLVSGLPEECPFESADPDQERQEPAIEPSPTPD